MKELILNVYKKYTAVKHKLLSSSMTGCGVFIIIASAIAVVISLPISLYSVGAAIFTIIIALCTLLLGSLIAVTGVGR